MKIDNIKAVYFIGAGGIGMSALVRYFLSKNKQVAGYDKTASTLTEQLIKEGADIHYTDDINQISAAFTDKDSTLVVYTPAVPSTHNELSYFRDRGFSVMKRSQVLGLITQETKGLCIAGTHGKTTTSTILAHLLKQSSVGCTAFLGGISQNYHTNLLLNEHSPFTVIEADEFDRSFHALRPYISVITSCEPDHLDIYGTKEAYLESFEYYTSLIQAGGSLIVHKDLEFSPRLKDEVNLYTYSKDAGDFHADNISISNGEIYLDFVGPNIRVNHIKLGVPIYINIENSIAALAVAHLTGATAEELKKGIETYRGVERRFEFILKTESKVLINDYAHHPAEVYQSIQSIKKLYPNKTLTTIFQPHLYSRTQDFYEEFAQSLSLSDKVILLDIYPAREEPIQGVTSKLILKEVAGDTPSKLVSKEELLTELTSLKTDIILTLGAGDIVLLLPAIKTILEG
ncbi:MAG: UDP-N-acetylmuramate--L-alanine ligase [Bacteroides sp.]